MFRAIVVYAVGSGRHGITMLAKDEEGIDRELRVSYFGQDQSWGQTKGIDFAPRDPGDHIGIGLGRKTLNHCLSCHTTWFRSVGPGSSGARGPEGEDHGIGCERCHGPGKNHGKAAESGFAELAIALAAKTPSQERLKSCVECHGADGSIQPGDPEFTRAQGTTFLFSRCFTAGKDRIGCTTCHDPHRPLDTVTAHYEAKCLNCHSGKLPPEAAVTAGGTAAQSLGPRTGLSGQSEGELHFLPYAQGRGTVTKVAVHRPSHPRAPRSCSGSTCGGSRIEPLLLGEVSQPSTLPVWERSAMIETEARRRARVVAAVFERDSMAKSKRTPGRGKTIRSWIAIVVGPGCDRCRCRLRLRSVSDLSPGSSGPSVVRRRQTTMRAREQLGRWLKEQPGSGEAQYYRAWDALARNQPREAVEAVDRGQKTGI